MKLFGSRGNHLTRKDIKIGNGEPPKPQNLRIRSILIYKSLRVLEGVVGQIGSLIRRVLHLVQTVVGYNGEWVVDLADLLDRRIQFEIDEVGRTALVEVEEGAVRLLVEVGRELLDVDLWGPSIV